MESMLQLVSIVQSAKLQLMAANMGQVNKLAWSYNHRNVSFQDLVEAGLSGLETGLTKFDPKRGAKLSTAVFFYIRDHMFKAYRMRSHVVQVPVTTQEQMYRVDACVKQYQQQHSGKQPTDEHIAKATKLTKHAVQRVWEMKQRRVLSIDALPSNNDGDLNEGNTDALIDLISTGDDPEQDVLAQHVQLHVTQLLDSLPSVMGTILRERYGLLDGQDKTYEEVGHSNIVCTFVHFAPVSCAECVHQFYSTERCFHLVCVMQSLIKSRFTVRLIYKLVVMGSISHVSVSI